MSAVTHTRRADLCAAAALLVFLSFPFLARTAEPHKSPTAAGLLGDQQHMLQSDSARAPRAQTPSTSKTATLADFAWLEGRWRGDWGPRTAEQIWTAPKAGLMLGTFRLIEDDKTLLIELYTVVQKPDGIDLRFRHFTPDLALWEKSDATLLTLQTFDATRFVFANSVNGEPKHAIFTRVNPDTYISRFEIVPTGGEMQVVEITYHRQKPQRS